MTPAAAGARADFGASADSGAPADSGARAARARVNAAVAAGSAAIRLRSRSRARSISGADKLAGRSASGTFGVQGGLQQDGRGGGVNHLAAGAGVLAAAAQRVVRFGSGEPLVDQPDRDRSEPSGQVRREF